MSTLRQSPSMLLAAYLNTLALSSIFFATFLLLNFATIAALVHKGLRRRRSVQIQLACVLTLLASTTLFYAFNFDNIHRLIQLGPYDYETLPYEPIIYWQEGVKTIMLTVNIFISDSVVWWRVYAIWANNKLVLSLGIFSLTVALVSGFSSVGPFFQDWQALPPQVAFQYMYTNYVPGLVSLGVSLATNTIAVVLIGVKAWKHRRMVKEQLGIKRNTRTMKILALLVESGGVYSMFWLAVLVTNSIEYQYLNKVSMFPIRGTTVFTNGCLVPLVGIYPLVVIILVAANSWVEERGQPAFLISTVRRLSIVNPATDIPAPAVQCLEPTEDASISSVPIEDTLVSGETVTVNHDSVV